MRHQWAVGAVALLLLLWCAVAVLRRYVPARESDPRAARLRQVRMLRDVQVHSGGAGREDMYTHPNLKGEPSIQDLVRLWLHTGVAKAQGVQDALVMADLSGRRGSAKVPLLFNARGTLGGMAGFDGLRETHGALRSSWHDEDWRVACSPFLKAFRAAEAGEGVRTDRRTTSVADINGSTPLAPVKVEFGRHTDLAEQLQLLTLGALLALATGRPFRAAVGRTFGPEYIQPPLADWRLPHWHYEAVKAPDRHMWVDNVTAALAAATANPYETLLLSPSVAHAWGCDVHGTAKQRDARPEVLMVLNTVAARLYRYGWDSAEVPLTRSTATTCMIRCLIHPAPTVLAHLDAGLEAAADVEGTGLILGVHVGEPAIGPEAAIQRLSCAWEATAAYHLQHAGRRKKPSTAWVLIGGGPGTPAAAQRFLAHRAGRNQSLTAPPTLLLGAAGNRSSTGAGTGATQQHSAAFRLWSEFFFLTEAHTCTFYKGMCGLARMACMIGLRRQLGNGLMLEATAPEHGYDGKEPQCARWTNGGLS